MKTSTKVVYFNSRSHEESDINRNYHTDIRGISIHALTRRATAFSSASRREASFQFTLSRGERRDWVRSTDNDDTFQFTLSRGERQRDIPVLPTETIFQFTLSRGERHNSASRVHLQTQISIHALTRRATFVIVKHRLRNLFQFTLSRGERRPGRQGMTLCDLISIHALTRRATVNFVIIGTIFNKSRLFSLY